MSSELINADFSRRIVIQTDDLPWIASPQVGVERRLLDRVGGEVARATSLVRYAPASNFPAHEHALGEEFLVLDGVFSDEHGDYPQGTYVRNPPCSRHSPRTATGCVILVKLRQMSLGQQRRIVVDTTMGAWERGDGGHAKLVLYAAGGGEEELVSLERLGASTSLPDDDCPGGEEIFVLSGDLVDEHGRYTTRTWIRNPVGFRRSLRSQNGTLYWVKRGHLQPR
jgi:anti-sigma factor ChrR (cupin superfamily)